MSTKDPRAAALQSLRYRTTDLGVKLALDLAAAGESVVYASDWDPGTKNLEKLAAASVETHTSLRRKR